MIAPWMLYAALLSGVIGLAALALEEVARALGRPVRRIWLSAIYLSAGLPLVAFVLARLSTSPPSSGAALSAPLGAVESGAEAAAPAAGGMSRILDPLVGWLEGAMDFGVPALDAWMLGGWVAGGSLLLTAVLAGGIGMARRRRSWPTRRVAGRRVHVSSNTGPAVVGVRTPAIVLPRWLLDAPAAQLEMILLHEEEHVSAHDTALLAFGLLPVLLVPWNPALWWQLRRLREGIEMDCDRRVLERGIAARHYGSVLLDVGSHRTPIPLPGAALAESGRSLPRRLRRMRSLSSRERWLRGVVGVVAAGLLVMVACESPHPTGGDPRLEGEDALPAEVGEEPRVRWNGDESPSPPLVFIDGIRHESDVQPRGVSLLASLRPEMIETIEIVKGPAAERLYGPEAAHGVIFIITKAASDPDREK